MTETMKLAIYKYIFIDNEKLSSVNIALGSFLFLRRR